MYHGQPRVAVVGAGPSGLYAAAALVAGHNSVLVDVLERLPTPFGLVRYGVAPDHLKMKSVTEVLRKPFGHPKVRFLGGVGVGPQGVPAEVLRSHFHAVVHATGCSVDRILGIPGEDLRGSFGSGDFVGWYSGHPDHTGLEPRLDLSDGVAIIGAGNVALDIARVLAKSANEMATTDVPEHVLAQLHASAVRAIHVFARRAPQHVRFTPAELRQLGELENADVIVHDGGSLERDRDHDRQQRNLDILTAWKRRQPAGKARRIHFWFLRSPVRVIAAHGRVAGVIVERNTVEPDGHVRGTGQVTTVSVQLVVRAIGYTAEPACGLPLDAGSGPVPNRFGRVLDGSGDPRQGAYVTGWLKRGPSGVVGTNKACANETVAALLEDLPSLPAPARPDPEDFTATLSSQGVRPIDWAGWLRLDAEEIRRGELRGIARTKVSSLAEMVSSARSDR